VPFPWLTFPSRVLPDLFHQAEQRPHLAITASSAEPGSYGVTGCLTSRCGQGFPAGDRPGAFPRPGVVDDAGEQPTQFDGRRQLALLLEDGPDRSGIGLIDKEHLPQDAGSHRGGQANVSG
jgi:hypothetical protein